MKKYLIILCIFILTALLFCSCGKKENDPGQTSEADISALTDPSSEEPTEPVVTEKPEKKTEPVATEPIEPVTEKPTEDTRHNPIELPEIKF